MSSHKTTLYTLSKKVTDSSALVYWAIGKSGRRKGIIKINLEFDCDEPDLVAELIAIRYLMLEKLGTSGVLHPGVMKHHRLVVSKGAIRKLALNKSSKKFAIKFASYLRSRLKGITIETSHSKELESIEECDDVVTETLDAETRVYAQDHYKLDTPAMGKLWVSNHAVEQYQARITTGDPKNPWASLFTRLRHPDLELHPLDEKVASHKRRKYGRSDNVEVWGHKTSCFRYLVVTNQDKKKTLVTVFEKRN